MKDYYSILKVSPAATADDIKKAFRTLALLYHPDKNKEPLAHTRFTEIREAYDTLRDPVKRAAYNYKRYASQPVHAHKTVVKTASDILHESQDLSHAVSRMDPFRVDLDAVSFRIRDILSAHKVSILLEEKNAALNLQVVQNIITALQLLPLPLAVDCLQPIQPLSASCPGIKTEINRFMSNAKWQFYWNRYKVIAALLAAVVFVMLLFLKGKKDA